MVKLQFFICESNTTVNIQNPISSVNNLLLAFRGHQEQKIKSLNQRFLLDDHLSKKRT